MAGLESRLDRVIGAKSAGPLRTAFGFETVRDLLTHYPRRLDDRGELTDFAQLTGFEDAAADVQGASEIRIKRFADRRATLSMNLENPVELLRELEERAPFDFVVRDTRRNGIVLDVDGDGREQQDRAA